VEALLDDLFDGGPEIAADPPELLLVFRDEPLKKAGKMALKPRKEAD